MSGVAVYRGARWGLVGVFALLVLAPTSSFVPIVNEVGAERRVRDIALDQRNEASFTVEGFGSDLIFAVVVVAGLADRTTLPSTFELRVVSDGG